MFIFINVFGTPTYAPILGRIQFENKDCLVNSLSKLVPRTTFLLLL